MNIISEKFKEVFFAVMPISTIVLLLHFTLTPLQPHALIKFILGAIFVILGLSIFLMGVDIGITPIGKIMGSAIAKSNKVAVIIVAGLALGFFISIAEPDLHILAGQVDFVTSGMISKNSIVLMVSLGIALMVALGFARIVYSIPLYLVLTAIYGFVLFLSFFTGSDLLPIAFDAAAAVTGALAVPFILALASGISAMKKDSRASEKDSFGLVAMSGTGPLICVMLMFIVSKTGSIPAGLEVNDRVSTDILSPFLQKLPVIAQEILIALAPIVILFLVFQKISFHLSKASVRRIMFGILYTFIGLVLFLLGVNAGFMEVASTVGYKLASMDSPFYVVAVGFLLGMVTVLAEPAVYVLNHQVEDVTSGYVKRNMVMLFLALGVAMAVSLSIIKILVPGLQLWHYLLPGYAISIALSYIVPKLFVGIAFDSGAVASGPMTATFILAFAQGAAEAIEGADVLIDGFGVIAMVAMTPVIALQILGLIFKVKSKKGGLEQNE